MELSQPEQSIEGHSQVQLHNRRPPSALSCRPLAFRDRGWAPVECVAEPSRDAHVATRLTEASTEYGGGRNVTTEDNNTKHSSNYAEHNNNPRYLAVGGFWRNAIPGRNRKIVTERDATVRHPKVKASISDVTPPDDLLFAPYQPVYRQPYDLSISFDRTNLALVINGHIAKCENEIERQTYRYGSADARLSIDLRRHRQALTRLAELGRY